MTMRYLRLGLRGEDVEAWNYFLRGLKPNSAVIADGEFDENTRLETISFQRSVGLKGDGIVGPMTMGKAMGMGFNPLIDDTDDDRSGPNWPPMQGFSSLSLAERESVFGKFSYVPAPVSSNPEAIRITDDWASKNVVSVEIPQLVGVRGAPKTGIIPFHRLAAQQLKAMFQAWEDAGLRHLILTWGGSWVPRFIRGSRSVLSNHAWATAFDINVQWNMLGTMPALLGKKGSVRELVPIANEHGFGWGGFWGRNGRGRPDGMHFQCDKIITVKV